MRKKDLVVRNLSMIVMATLVLASPAFAGNQEEFCVGFEEGYKTIKGDIVLVPICPIAPITPIGSTPFREGIKAGLSAASK